MFTILVIYPFGSFKKKIKVIGLVFKKKTFKVIGIKFS